MNTVHPNIAVVNPPVSPQAVNWNSAPTAWVSVDQEPDGTFVWRIERTDGRLGTCSHAQFVSFDDAADAAIVIAEVKGLPLAADVSIFLEMASPWYSEREQEMEVAL